MKKFLFVLSPSLALYNQWKDILKELKIQDYNVDVLIPKPISYKSILSSLKVIESELEIGKFIVLINPLNPYSLKKLRVTEIEELSNQKLFRLQVLIRQYLEKTLNKFSYKPINLIVNNFIRYISSVKFFQKIKISLFKNNYEFLLYDIFEEKKNYIFPYLIFFYDMYRLSLFHANGISCTHYKNKKFWSPITKLTVLDFTGINKSLYDWNLANKNFKYKIIGVPSHFYDKKKILKNTPNIHKELIKDLKLREDIKFIGLASRPNDNNWCNFIDRNLYLKTIGKFLVCSKNYHLLIKAHPKEQSYTKKQWAELLGIKLDSKYFSITKITSLNLAAICEFGFSFVSDCCVDFASLGKPMIELTSKEKINYSNSSPFYDQDGFPLTALAAKKIAFNIRNPNELRLFFEDLDNKVKQFSKEVNQGYKDCYGKYQYKPGMFLDYIETLSSPK